MDASTTAAVAHDTSTLMIAVIAAGSVIAGAAVGSVSSYFTTKLQLRSARDHDIDRRLFDARRVAYEKALVIFTFAHNERMNGRKWPKHSTDVEAQWKSHEVMGPVSLWSSKELVVKMRDFFGYLQGALPTTIPEHQQQDLYGNTAWQHIIKQMRDDVGTGEFLDLPIPELPTYEEFERQMKQMNEPSSGTP